MKLILVYSLFFLSLFSFGQKIGSVENKIEFIGVRKDSTFNGLSLSIFSSSRKREVVNGMLFGGLYVAGARKLNGIAIGGLYTLVGQANGLVIAPFISKIDTLNGLTLTPGGIYNKLNGISISFLGINSKENNGVVISSLLVKSLNTNGIVISPFNLIEKSLKGISFGILNKTTTGRCFQLGLINIIESNPIWCRYLPVINMRFEKSENSKK